MVTWEIAGWTQGDGRLIELFERGARGDSVGPCEPAKHSKGALR